MNKVNIVIDFEIPKGLAELYAEMNDCEFLGNKNEAMSVEQALVKLQHCASTTIYANSVRLGIMKIYCDDELAGVSFPRIINAEEFEIFKINADLPHYRIGPVYIAKDFRFRGIMRNTIIQFKELYPNMIWTCNELNNASSASAIAAGLKLSHCIYVKPEGQWEFTPNPDTIRVSKVFKSEVV